MGILKKFLPLELKGEKKSRNKYKNVKVKCLSGHDHDSKLEADHCNGLMADVRLKRIVSFEIKPQIRLEVNGVLICVHYPDFLVEYPLNLLEFHETKGHRTADWEIKRKLTEALYPHIRYVVIE